MAFKYCCLLLATLAVANAANHHRHHHQHQDNAEDNQRMDRWWRDSVSSQRRWNGDMGDHQQQQWGMMSNGDRQDQRQQWRMMNNGDRQWNQERRAMDDNNRNHWEMNDEDRQMDQRQEWRVMDNQDNQQWRMEDNSQRNQDENREQWRSNDGNRDQEEEWQFAYEVRDPMTGDFKAHEESRRGDMVRGRYSMMEADGSRRIVDYTADDRRGFNAQVRKEGWNRHPY